LLHQSAYETTYEHNLASTDAVATELLNSDAVKPEFKKLKEKLKEASAAHKEFDAYLNEEAVAFKETVMEQLEIVKAAKEVRMASVKQSALYKKYNRMKMSFTLMLARFQKKYPNITNYSIRRKLGRTNWYRIRYAGPAHEMKRKFNLRKWY
jgi:hypothetical protein